MKNHNRETRVAAPAQSANFICQHSAPAPHRAPHKQDGHNARGRMLRLRTVLAPRAAVLAPPKLQHG